MPRCVHQLFEEQAARRLRALAISHPRGSVTYGELELRANQVAHHLRALGVGRGARVALCVDRSPDLLWGLLGISKAGAALAAIEPERLPDSGAWLQRLGVETIVTQGRWERQLAGRPERLVLLDQLVPEVGPARAAPAGGARPEDVFEVAAFGEGPQALPPLAVTHAERAAALVRAGEFLGPRPTVTALAPLGSAAAAVELLAPLCLGGTVELLPLRLELVLVGSFTLEPVKDATQAWLDQIGLGARVRIGPYAQVFQQLLDPASALRENRDGLGVVLVRLEDWAQGDGPAAGRAGALDENVRRLLEVLAGVAARRGPPLLLCLCPWSEQVRASPERARAIGHAAEWVRAEAGQIAGLRFLDVEAWFARRGLQAFNDDETDRLGHVPYTAEAISALGEAIARDVFSRQSASPYRGLLLDCDQTIWAGNCGEPGPEAVSIDAPGQALQGLAAAASREGAKVCLCARAAEADALEVLRAHRELPLRPRHLTSWRVSFVPVAERVAALGLELRMDPSELVYVSGQPTECRAATAAYPELLVLELPQRRAEIPVWLSRLWAFGSPASEAVGGSPRPPARAAPATLGEFLSSLNTEVELMRADESSAAAVADLTWRVSEFNCTGVRLHEEEVRGLLAEPTHAVLRVQVRDRFGDYGAAGAVIARAGGEVLEVEAFLLSCRVLGKGVEVRVLDQLKQLARDGGLARLGLRYRPTARNHLAAEFIRRAAPGAAPGEGGEIRAEVPVAQPGAGPLPAEAPAAPLGVPPQAPAAQTTPFPPAQARALGPPRATIERLVAARWRAVPAGERVARLASAARGEQRHPRSLRARAPLAVSREGRPVGDLVCLDAADEAMAFRSLPLVALPAFGPVEFEVASAAAAPGPGRAPAGGEPGFGTALERTLAAMWAEVGVVAGGREGDFFLLGGHSLRAIGVLARVKKALGVEVPLAAMLERPRLAELAAHLEGLIRSSARAQSVEIRRALPSVRLPLAFQQERHWQIHQQMGGNPFFNVAVAERLSGPLDAGALEQALDEILRRHAVLRTTVATDAQGPRQVVAEPVASGLTKLEAGEGGDAAVHELVEHTCRAFDLSRGPLWRFALARLGKEEHVFCACMPHAVADGESAELFRRELWSHYAAFATGRPPPLSEPAFQYGDYALWQRRQLGEGPMRALQQYWRSHLERSRCAVGLPFDRAFTPKRATPAHPESIAVSAALRKAVEEAARRARATPFMLMLAALNAVLARWTGQLDLVVSAPIANRPLEAEGLLGCFNNNLPLRSSLEAGDRFCDLVDKAKRAALGGFAHRDCPTLQIAEALDGDASVANRFTISNVLLNLPGASPGGAVQALQHTPFARAAPSLVPPFFDLMFSSPYTPPGTAFPVRCFYSADHFEQATAQGLLEGFLAALEVLVARPSAPLSSFRLPPALAKSARQG